MAKGEKVVVLREEDAEIVDVPYTIDTQIKNQKLEFDAAREELVRRARQELDTGETKVRLVGELGSALVTSAEEFVLDVKASRFEEVEKAVSDGRLDEVVEVKVKAHIVPGMVGAVKAALEDAGMDPAEALSLETSYKIDSDGYRKLQVSKTASPEKTQIADAIQDASKKKESVRVTFRAK